VLQKGIDITTLLVVSHDSAVLRSLSSIGESNDWQCESADNAWEAIERVLSGVAPDLLLLDQPQGDAEGLHILRWLRRLRPTLPIILIGHPDDAGRKQEAIRIGARDYLVKPLDNRQLELAIGQNFSQRWEDDERDITSDDVELVDNDNFFIGISPIMRKLRAQAALLAEANMPVLILGESGSGKETTARLLHKLSVRSGFEFAKVNCAALPSDLLERELFGYQQNGTPGRTKPGKLELCAKGTILLDEITEMSIDLQAHLLQVLQTKRFLRPGTSAPIEVDVRVLASSSANMEHALSENRLREDLYYRLSAYTIHVPSLRERKEELRVLSRHFMHQLARHYGLSPRDFSPAIIEACQSYAWPGNLRELETFVKRYLMMGDGDPAFAKGLASLYEVKQSIAFRAPQTSNPPAPLLTSPRDGPAGSGSLKSLVQGVKLETEKHAIAAALEKTGWNRKAAARLLKVSYRTLLYKIEQYQMRSSDSALFPGDIGLKSKGTGFRGNGRTD
jgi:two-component system, NtrC family, response regulator AtoC